jgi:putative intracellular protease/amidase
MKILMVLTSPGNPGDAGSAAASRIAEFAAPYYALKDAGAAVTLARSPATEPLHDTAGDAPAPVTRAVRRFTTDPLAQAALAGTRALGELATGDFDAVFYPGGKPPVWDWPNMKSPVP